MDRRVREEASPDSTQDHVDTDHQDGMPTTKSIAKFKSSSTTTSRISTICFLKLYEGGFPMIKEDKSTVWTDFTWTTGGLWIGPALFLSSVVLFATTERMLSFFVDSFSTAIGTMVGPDYSRGLSWVLFDHVYYQVVQWSNEYVWKFSPLLALTILLGAIGTMASWMEEVLLDYERRGVAVDLESFVRILPIVKSTYPVSVRPFLSSLFP